MLKKLHRLFILCLPLALVCLGIGATLFIYYSKDLPDHKQLASYNPNTLTRLYASDGKLLAEYAKEKRLFVPINAIPKRLIHAFLAAEDKNFYHHPGIDFTSIARATIQNIMNLGTNRRLVGGSTITQQVVKNFLLSEERTLQRKMREAILAFRISQIFSKDRILELYLNEIYLGSGSYGVAAAALNYFDKSIDELTIDEAAMLAALPKAPSTYNPRKNYNRALERRNWVINRMEEEDFINGEETLAALNAPITLRSRADTSKVKADFFAEAVRRQILKQYGEDTLYTGGLLVRTTLAPDLQEIAEAALQKGLVAYDRRHGWRGPIAFATIDEDWQDHLQQFSAPSKLPDWQLAIVLDIEGTEAIIGLKDGTIGKIPLKYLGWARQWVDDDTLGPTVSTVRDVLDTGNVILVEKQPSGFFALRQIPAINGAVVIMDPHNGRVLAMMGGFNYGDSQFNRAIQAIRQPGSAFKPFVYLTALENNFTPASLVIDAEIELDQGPDEPSWKPQNYSGRFYGPTTLRKGLEKSRNVMTVRLAQMVGIQTIIDIAKRFDITDNPERNFAMVLGASETTLMRLSNAYAMLVNGGKRITPSLIERIQDRNGNTIFRRDQRPCNECSVDTDILDDADAVNLPSPPRLADNREPILDPQTAYQITSMLQGVVDRGTGRKAKRLNRTLGGKTGTTNLSNDTWFIGFTPDLVVGVFAGFDTPRSLGKKETGASVALPIFIDIMEGALKNKPDIPFRIPDDIKLVKIDMETGLLPIPNTPKENILLEGFKTGTEPTSSSSLKLEHSEDEVDEFNTTPDIGNTGIY